VQDTVARLEEVRRLILRIDIPVPQVLIEARIVEADDSFRVRSASASAVRVAIRAMSVAVPTAAPAAWHDLRHRTGRNRDHHDRRRNWRWRHQHASLTSTANFVNLPAQGIVASTRVASR